MIGPDQITVPVRNGTVVRNFGTIYFWSGPWSELKWYGPWSEIWSEILVRDLFGTVRGPNFWSEIDGPVRGPNFWSVISVPVRDGPVRSEIFPKLFIFGPDHLRTDLFGPKLVRSVFSQSSRMNASCKICPIELLVFSGDHVNSKMFQLH